MVNIEVKVEMAERRLCEQQDEAEPEDQPHGFASVSANSHG